MARIGLAQRLKAMGFDKPYVRLVRVNAQDKSKIDAHVTAYAMISKQDGLPTVRLTFQDFTSKNGTVAVTYDMGRIHGRAMKLARFVEVVMLARALMAAGLVEFYDDVSQSAETKPTTTTTMPTSTPPAPGANMEAIMTAIAANPQLLAQIMTLIGAQRAQGHGKSQDQNQDEGEVYVG